MKFFKKLFKKKSKEKEVEQIIDDGLPKCDHCGQSLIPNTPIHKFPKKGVNKKTYHRKCWKATKKMATDYQVSGIMPSIEKK